MLIHYLWGRVSRTADGSRQSAGRGRSAGLCKDSNSTRLTSDLRHVLIAFFCFPAIVSHAANPIWIIQVTVIMLLSVQVAKQKKKKNSQPTCFGLSALLALRRRLLSFCGALIGFRVVIPSTHSERNDSFNGNHGKRHPRAVVQSIQAGEGDLLGCINMVSASRWQANGRSVHVGHQASLVY